MLTKDQYLASMDHEFTVIRHLVSKLTEADLEYRPTPAQRSVYELIQYLSTIFIGATLHIQSGTRDGYAALTEEAQTLTLANFDERMAKQAAQFREIVSGFTEEQLNEEVMTFSMQSRAMHLVNGPLKFAASYKTQLFTYMKQNGRPELKTSNLWGGKDPQAEA